MNEKHGPDQAAVASRRHDASPNAGRRSGGPDEGDEAMTIGGGGGGDDDDDNNLYQRWKAYIDSDDDYVEATVTSSTMSYNSDHTSASQRSLYSRSSLRSMEVQVDARLKHCPAEGHGVVDVSLQERIARKLVVREQQKKIQQQQQQLVQQQHEHSRRSSARPLPPGGGANSGSQREDAHKSTFSSDNDGAYSTSTTTPIIHNLSPDTAAKKSRLSSSSSPSSSSPGKKKKNLTYYQQELARLEERRGAVANNQHNHPPADVSSSSRRSRPSHDYDTKDSSQRSLTSSSMDEDILVMPRSNHGPSKTTMMRTSVGGGHVAHHNMMTTPTYSKTTRRPTSPPPPPPPTPTPTTALPHPANAFDWLLDTEQPSGEVASNGGSSLRSLYGRNRSGSSKRKVDFVLPSKEEEAAAATATAGSGKSNRGMVGVDDPSPPSHRLPVANRMHKENEELQPYDDNDADDNSNDYAYAVEIDFEQQERENKIRNRRWWRRCGGYGIVLSIIIVCAIIMARSSWSGRAELSTLHPREYIGIRERAERWLLPQHDDGSAASPPPPPHELEQVVDWLIFHDTVLPTDPHFYQRLILIGVYYSTHGESWHGNCGKPELNWCTIQVAGSSRTMEDEEEEEPTLQGRRPWLTAHEGTDECDWAGVGCDATGHVVELLLDDLVRDCEVVPFAWLRHLPFLRTMRLTKAGCETLPELSYRDGRHYRTLVFDDNALNARLPASWYTALPNMRELHLAGNFLTGSLSSDLGSLRAMKLLDLHGNRFNGTIPDVFDQLPSISHIMLNDNRFEGRIPPSLLQIGGTILTAGNQNNTTNISAIARLDVGENRLTGTIPPLARRTWNVLRFDYNQLTGTLPSSLVDQIDTVELDVSSNRLSGSLSAGFGQWQQATRLFFSNNAFTGKLPEEMGYLPLLQELALDRNSFDGSVPDTYCQRGGDQWDLPSIENVQADCLAAAATDVMVAGNNNDTDAPSKTAETPCACCRSCCYDGTGECQSMISKEGTA
jgi:hypothetical protein